MVVGDAQDAVLAPAVGARAGVVVGEIVPCHAVGGVVLTHCPPLAVGEIGPPSPPMRCPRQCLVEPPVLRRERTLVAPALGETIEVIRHGRTRGTTSCRRPRRWS